MIEANAPDRSRPVSPGATRRTYGLLRALLQRPELASLGGLAAAFVVFSILRPDLFLSNDNGVNVASLAAQPNADAAGGSARRSFLSCGQAL